MTASGAPAVELQNAGKKFCEDFLLGSRYAASDLFSTPPSGLRPREFFALRGVSFSLNPGDRLGIAGPPRSGKSTLASLVAGLFPPDEGRVSLAGRFVFAGRATPGMKSVLTVRENATFQAALCGARFRDSENKAREILRFAGLSEDADRCLYDVEPHRARRLGLAAALLSDADVYVLDGLPAGGDAEFRQSCLDKIMELGPSKIMVVADDEETLGVLAQKLLVLEEGRTAYFGDRSDDFLYRSSLYEKPETPHADDSPDDAEDDPPEAEAAVDNDAPKLRGALSGVCIGGIPQNYVRTCFLSRPGHAARVEFDFLPHESFECAEPECRLFARFQHAPLGAKRLASAPLRLEKGVRYHFSFQLELPTLRRGVFGLAVTLPAAGQPVLKRDVYKIMRVGMLTPEPDGSSIALDVRDPQIDRAEAAR